jgi:MFS family permease
MESFCLFRMLTRAGIGGEYSAVNSTIQEMIPARYRGWTDLAINGTFWIGVALGAGGSLVQLVSPPTSAGGSHFSSVPDSASSFFSSGHGSVKARAGSSSMEKRPKQKKSSRKSTRLHGASFPDASAFTPMRLRPRAYTPLVLGPLVLGPLFDSIGRRLMIAFTYAASGFLLAGSGWLFANHLIDAGEQTIIWTAVFFFASSAAGAAYLTASEIFPVEIRALAVAFFYAAGTAVGGVGAPFLFGALIQTGSRASVFGLSILLWAHGHGCNCRIDLGRGC